VLIPFVEEIGNSWCPISGSGRHKTTIWRMRTRPTNCTEPHPAARMPFGRVLKTTARTAARASSSVRFAPVVKAYSCILPERRAS